MRSFLRARDSQVGKDDRATTQHGNGGSFGCERAWCAAVSMPRQTADDGESCIGELIRQLFGAFRGVMRRLPRADNSDCGEFSGRPTHKALLEEHGSPLTAADSGNHFA